MNKFLSRYTKHLLLLEHGEKGLDDLVHLGDHRLAVSESLLPLLVIVGLEVGVAPIDSRRHQIEVLAQAGAPAW